MYMPMLVPGTIRTRPEKKILATTSIIINTVIPLFSLISSTPPPPLVAPFAPPSPPSPPSPSTCPGDRCHNGHHHCPCSLPLLHACSLPPAPAFAPPTNPPALGPLHRALRIPLPDPRLASTALEALSVDPELSPLVQRSLSLDSAQTLLCVDFNAATNRMLRVAVNSFLDSIKLVLDVMEQLDVDVLAQPHDAAPQSWRQ
ncbi:EKC/KEOPS complex, subunit Pcc1 [Ophiocordyceps sinensis CO18]|uniref:EKC/KEOPS complex, subunit Pcc1 n=1 Tax=Ophiocordyceps sinensis (strain Co18 / CGMCC 3.14243) TaxID=911162 RepID=T5A6T6_OPHSC|nr:EKC/KEOPS complex, subunit Pcc1 [Ophiocordyceps sinensis CO18]